MTYHREEEICEEVPNREGRFGRPLKARIAWSSAAVPAAFPWESGTSGAGVRRYGGVMRRYLEDAPLESSAAGSAQCMASCFRPRTAGTNSTGW